VGEVETADRWPQEASVSRPGFDGGLEARMMARQEEMLPTLPRDKHVGTFAEGEETPPRDEEVGSFAEGHETLPRDEHVGSFAEGEEPRDD
jgi:hypothetical protein